MVMSSSRSIKVSSNLLNSVARGRCLTYNYFRQGVENKVVLNALQAEIKTALRYLNSCFDDPLMLDNVLWVVSCTIAGALAALGGTALFPVSISALIVFVFTTYIGWDPATTQAYWLKNATKRVTPSSIARFLRKHPEIHLEACNYESDDRLLVAYLLVALYQVKLMSGKGVHSPWGMLRCDREVDLSFLDDLSWLHTVNESHCNNAVQVLALLYVYANGGTIAYINKEWYSYLYVNLCDLTKRKDFYEVLCSVKGVPSANVTHGDLAKLVCRASGGTCYLPRYELSRVVNELDVLKVKWENPLDCWEDDLRLLESHLDPKDVKHIKEQDQPYYTLVEYCIKHAISVSREGIVLDG